MVNGSRQGQKLALTVLSAPRHPHTHAFAVQDPPTPSRANATFSRQRISTSMSHASITCHAGSLASLARGRSGRATSRAHGASYLYQRS